MSFVTILERQHAQDVAKRKGAASHAASKAPDKAPAPPAKPGPAPGPATARRARLATIKSKGEPVAVQLHLDGGGPGRSRYFALSAFGGDLQAAKDRATQVAHELGAVFHAHGGSDKGRKTCRTTCNSPGFSFLWERALSGLELRPGQKLQASSWLLRLRAQWTSPDGRACGTSYSVSAHGPQVAVDKAIKKRVAAGFPPPDREALIQRAQELLDRGRQ